MDVQLYATADWIYDRPGSWGGVWTRHHGAGVRVTVTVCVLQLGGRPKRVDKGKIVSSLSNEGRAKISPTN